MLPPNTFEPTPKHHFCTKFCDVLLEKCGQRIALERAKGETQLLKPEWFLTVIVMRNVAFSRTLWIGIVMLGLGFEIWFVNDLSLPLGFVWIVGPLLWYGGFVVVTFFFGSRLLSCSTTSEQNTQVEATKSQTSKHAGKAAMLACFLVVGLLVPSNALAADATATFKAKCAMCHGAAGDGKTVMGAKLSITDLKSKPVQSQSDAQLNAAITSGKAKMPAFSEKLSKAEITAMVAYIRTLGQ